MKKVRCYSRSLLWLHLFVCLTWLFLYRATHQPPTWSLHVWVWSILGVQFTWGLTIGLMVGPSRSRRPDLWWSLLTIFMPMQVVAPLVLMITVHQGLLIGLMYVAVFTMILASETFCGVLLGAKLHNELTKTDA